MKWLSKITDPNLLPLKVRTFSALIIIVSSQCIIWSNADHLHKLSGIGITLGVLGAGFLYWETIVSDRELEIISNALTYLGSTRRLSPGDIAWVILFALVMVPVLLLGICSIIYQHMHGLKEGALHTTFRVGLWLFAYSLPAFSSYGCSKWMRVLYNRWHETVRASQDDDRKAVIKRILRRIGFASLVGAGILQFPITLL
jgi:hypothetical protein